MSENRNKLVVVVGPTAAHKSQLALALAKKFNGEIVTADSMQVYRGMDIGTGKVSKKDRRAVKHYLLDIVGPAAPFTLALWQKRAFGAVDTVLERNKVPLLVGGTGLYIASIVDSYHIPQTVPNARLRNKLAKLSTAELFALLKKNDPVTAKKIDWHNKRRLIRALEHVQSFRTSFSASQRKDSMPYDTLIIGIRIPREQLYERINKRVVAMQGQGLEREVKRVRSDLRKNRTAMQAIGYKEWEPYFKKQASLDDTIALIQKNTRNYAKRQMTWFRGMEKKHTIHWISEQKEAERLIREFLKK